MKAIKFALISFCVMTLLTNCNKNEDTTETTFELKTADSLDINEYKIYSLILDEVFTKSQLVVEQKTAICSYNSFSKIYLDTLNKVNSNLDTTIFQVLNTNNVATYNLDKNRFFSSKTITLISEQEIEHIFSGRDLNKSWENFHNKYPNANGIIQFTRVGINPSKTQAIVEMGHSYASLGGEGYLIYLVKENGCWKIACVLYTWVS